MRYYGRVQWPTPGHFADGQFPKALLDAETEMLYILNLLEKMDFFVLKIRLAATLERCLANNFKVVD